MNWRGHWKHFFEPCRCHNLCLPYKVTGDSKLVEVEVFCNAPLLFSFSLALASNLLMAIFERCKDDRYKYTQTYRILDISLLKAKD